MTSCVTAANFVNLKLEVTDAMSLSVSCQENYLHCLQRGTKYSVKMFEVTIAMFTCEACDVTQVLISSMTDRKNGKMAMSYNSNKHYCV